MNGHLLLLLWCNRGGDIQEVSIRPAFKTQHAKINVSKTKGNKLSFILITFVIYLPFNPVLLKPQHLFKMFNFFISRNPFQEVLPVFPLLFFFCPKRTP